MILHSPHLLTRIQVYEPRYHDKMVLALKRKVDFASPVIIFEFPKSKSYKDGRYCMQKQQAQSYPTQPHGNSSVYLIPLQDMEPWLSGAEERDLALTAFEDV